MLFSDPTHLSLISMMFSSKKEEKRLEKGDRRDFWNTPSVFRVYSADRVTVKEDRFLKNG